MIKDFDGKVAVVTGAASGIGMALCRSAAERGMRVVMADVEAAALEQAAKEIAGSDAEVLAVRTDVSQPDALSALAEQAVDRFGRVHLLCNNAGVFAGGLSWQAPQSDYEWVFGVNVWGVVNGLRSFLPAMLEHGEDGHIVNTASMAGVTTAPFAAPYYMSKHAVLSLSESLYLELQAKGARIGVSALCPELVSTGIANGERNRPKHLERKPGEGESPERDLIEGAIKQVISTGTEPRVLAERAFAAVSEDRFYVLAPDGNPWRIACETRLEDIRSMRNPTSVAPETG
jgi:NAD(P)-dependent dehydrogenase (short-subunit alcohol dehydrogenase family)